MVEAPSARTFVAATPLKKTLTSPVSVKFSPLIVTAVEPAGGPNAGETPVNIGPSELGGGMNVGSDERAMMRISSIVQPSAVAVDVELSRKRMRALGCPASTSNFTND